MEMDKDEIHTELTHKEDLIRELNKRRRILEKQLAQQGIQAMPHITIEIDSLKEQIAKHESEIANLKAQLRQLQEQFDRVINTIPDLQKDHTDNSPYEALKQEGKPLERDALVRMRTALSEEGYRWRTIKRLSVIAAISDSEACDILRSDPEVVFGVSSSGEMIARLKQK